MSYELDHLFILSSRGAPEAGGLIRLGLVEGAPNRHPGQGTANRRFFFRNAFLELLWVEDAAEAQSALVQRTKLWERWLGRDRDCSPFGIGLRLPLGPGSTAALSTWDYRPPYLPDPLSIQMGTNSEVVVEPLVFSIDFGGRPDAQPPERRQPLDHPVGWQTIARVVIGTKHSAAPTPELSAIEKACPWLTIEPAAEETLELGFDGQRRGESADLRPALPLIVRW